MIARMLCAMGLPLTALTGAEALAEEGAVSLTTEPRRADIYVDGRLKAKETPVVLRLPEGEHLPSRRWSLCYLFVEDGLT